MLQTAVKFLISTVTVVLFIGSLTINNPLIVLALSYYPVIYDVYTFSSPIFLLATR